MQSKAKQNQSKSKQKQDFSQKVKW